MWGDNIDLRARTKAYALAVIRLVQGLPRHDTAGVIGKQLLRSATSVGANYRAAKRARSTADFIATMSIVEEEADETLYWLELLIELRLAPTEQLAGLMAEGNELVAITVASINTAQKRQATPSTPAVPRSRSPS